jgi:alcohol dehydrogenase
VNKRVVDHIPASLDSLGRFDFELRARVVFGEHALDRLGELARQLSFTRTLIVADPGIAATGYVERAAAMLEAERIGWFLFHDFDVNPDTRMVEAGRASAARHRIDSIVAIGGGSSLDCAKGINFLFTNGGSMGDYQGFGKARAPMLPSIGIPTTAGTGSEAQSYALISDADTHLKMACGDPKAAFRAAILDPVLTVSQPREVAAVAGYDALSHAIESFVTARRTAISNLFAAEAWRLLEAHYQRVLEMPEDLPARGAMLLGAHQAGIAIEQSMLGAAHACANPLTAHHGTAHGIAIAVMLPHVVRWNAAHVGDRYRRLMEMATGERDSGVSVAAAADWLAARVEGLRGAGGLPQNLREIGVSREELSRLAADAAQQWTGTFNPRPFDAAGAGELYERAY